MNFFNNTKFAKGVLGAPVLTTLIVLCALFCGTSLFANFQLEASTAQNGLYSDKIEAKEGDKIFVRVKNTDEIGLPADTVFKVLAPTVLRDAGSVTSITLPKETLQSAGVEYILPFSLGIQGEREFDFTLYGGPEGSVLTPLKVKLSDGFDLVKLQWTSDKNTYYDGDTIMLKGQLVDKQGLPFDYSLANMLNKQLAPSLTLPFSAIPNSIFETGSQNPIVVTPPESITLTRGNAITPFVFEFKTIEGGHDPIFAKFNTKPDPIMGITAGELNITVENKSGADGTEIWIKTAKTVFNALEPIDIEFEMGALNNSSGTITFDFEVSEKDVFAERATGERYVGKTISIPVAVNKKTGKKELRFVPESPGKYTITLNAKNYFKVVSAPISIIVLPIANVNAYEYALSLSPDDIVSNKTIKGSDTCLLYVSSYYRANAKDLVRMGVRADTSKTIEWNVQAEPGDAGELTNETKVELSEGNAQKELLLNAKGMTGFQAERIYTFTPTDSSIKGVKVVVSPREGNMLSFVVKPAVAKKGETVSIRAVVVQGSSDTVKTRLYISPEHVSLINNYRTLFNDSGFSKEIFEIYPSQTSSTSIDLTLLEVNGDHYAGPVSIKLSPSEFDPTNLSWRQSTLKVLDKPLELKLERVNGEGNNSTVISTDVPIYEGEDVYYRLTLDRPVTKDFRTRVAIVSSEYVTSTPLIDFKIGAGYQSSTKTINMIRKDGFDGVRDFVLNWDNYYEQEASEGEFVKTPIPAYQFMDARADVDGYLFTVSKYGASIADPFFEGDSVLLDFNLGMTNQSGRPFEINVKLTSNIIKLEREIPNLQDSYIIRVNNQQDSGRLIIPTNPRIRLQGDRSIDFTATPGVYDAKVSILNIKDTVYKIPVTFIGVNSSVVEGSIAKMKATLPLGNNSDTPLILTIRGENALESKGYPDWVNPIPPNKDLQITFDPDQKEVLFDMETANLQNKFEARFGKIELVDYPKKTDRKDEKAENKEDEGEYLYGDNTNPLKITYAQYVPPTYSYKRAILTFEGGREDRSLRVHVREPLPGETNAFIVEFEQISGTIPRNPKILTIEREGSSAIEGVNYNFSDGKSVLEFYTYDEKGEPYPEIIAKLNVNLINDYNDDKTFKELIIALGTDHGIESSQGGREHVIFEISPKFLPMNKAGVGFSKDRSTPVVYTSAANGYDISVFCRRTENLVSVDIRPTGLVHNVDYKLYTSSGSGEPSELYYNEAKKSFTFEIPAELLKEENGNGWANLKFKPINSERPGVKDRRFTLKMVSSKNVAINSSYSSTSLVLRNNNPYANADQLVIPLDRQLTDKRYYVDCLANDKSWKKNETSYQTGLQILSVSDGAYGTVKNESSQVYYYDKAIDSTRSFLDIFNYTVREMGQGVNKGNVFIYKAEPYTINMPISVPLLDNVSYNSQDKLHAIYFDTFKDPQCLKPIKLAVKSEINLDSMLKFEIVGKPKMASTSAINGVLKSNNYSSGVLDSPRYHLNNLGVRIVSNKSTDTHYGMGVIACTVLTAPRLNPLTDSAIIKLKNEFAVEIDGDFFGKKPIFYLEYMHYKTNKIKRVKTPILTKLYRESGQIEDVSKFQKPGRGGKFFVKFPLISEGAHDSRIDLLVYNQCAYGALQKIPIYDIAWENFPQYAAPKPNDASNYNFYLSDKNEMIVGITGDYFGLKPSFRLTYRNLKNELVNVVLPVLSSFVDNNGKIYDVKGWQNPKIGGIFCVKLPFIFQSVDQQSVSITIDNGHGRAVVRDIDYNTMINGKYPNLLHTPSLKKVTPTANGDIYEVQKGKIIVRVTGDYLGKTPVFYARYFDNKYKMKTVKLKIVTTFYTKDNFYKDVLSEQSPVLEARFYLELPNVTQFNKASSPIDIIVTTSASAISPDFYSAVKKVIYNQ